MLLISQSFSDSIDSCVLRFISHHIDAVENGCHLFPATRYMYLLQQQQQQQQQRGHITSVRISRTLESCIELFLGDILTAAAAAMSTIVVINLQSRNLL